MNIIGANGDCLLVLSTDLEIQCALLPSKKVVCVWPFDCLRRYWCGDGLFGFECGRRSPHGEGRFVFITNQDEKLYKRLERFIEKAKRGSVFSTSSSEASLVDDRPPAPLPSESRHSETPPVKSSESDDELENPPLPPKPHGGMHMPLSSDVSTNPAYVVRTHSNAAATGHQWLHESIESPGGSLRRRASSRDTEQPNPHAHPPLRVLDSETIRTRDPLEEDTYSHTVHSVPAPFLLQRDHSTAVGESTYNALVHPKGGPKASPKDKKHPSEDKLYDVAYPDPKARPIMHPDTEEDEYSKPSFEATDGVHIPRTTMPLSKMPLGKPEVKRVLQTQLLDAEAPMSASLQSEDGMTRNPLYGSQSDLLDAIESLEGQIKEEIERPVVSSLLLASHESQPALNPTYGQVSLATAAKDTEEVKEQPDNDKTNVSQENGDVETDSPRVQSAEGCTVIEKDSKGYSKVDKNNKRKQEECPDLETPPDAEDAAPPLPDRLYSCDSSDAITSDV